MAFTAKVVASTGLVGNNKPTRRKTDFKFGSIGIGRIGTVDMLFSFLGSGLGSGLGRKVNLEVLGKICAHSSNAVGVELVLPWVDLRAIISTQATLCDR